MGKKLANAPVYYVLAQLRFNTLALLDRYVPALQDSLRKAGFPDFNKQILASMSVNLGAGGGQVVPAWETQTRYYFLDAARMSGFLLDQSSLSFQTTDYDVFETFSEAFRRGLGILHDTIDLSFSERLGLRYLDAVCPQSGESLAQYLTPSMLGLSELIGDRTLLHSSSETKAQNGKITLLGRVTILDQTTQGAIFPQELHPVPLQIAERFRAVSGRYGIIDTDGWIECREKFDIEAIGSSLRLLQDEIRFSFDKTVTPYALKAWE